MIHEIFESIGAFFAFLLSMIGFGSLGSGEVSGNKLRVFIKHGGRQISVDLDPTWNVRKIKSVVAPKLDLSADELKIIFAGKELPDDLILETCNVGQQSMLYAVKVQIRTLTYDYDEPTSSTNSTRDVPKNSPAPVPSSASDPEVASTLGSVAADTVRSRSRTTSENVTSQSLGTDGGIFNDGDTTSTSTVCKQSEYFVYCNTCEGIQEGKLRVRCDKCLSGAFTVLRAPENWQDVIKPKQVPGSCETYGCLGDTQFYFKCASHVTSGEDDSAPPLPQFKRNPDSIPCLACGDASDPVFIFECASQHVTCVDCFKQYILIKLNERQFIQDSILGYTLGCPALCSDSLIKDSHHFKLLGKYDYDRYQRFATEECLLKMGGVFCPQPDCGMGIQPIDVGCDKISCSYGCGYVFCRRCLEGWHLGKCNEEGSSQAQNSGESGGQSSSGSGSGTGSGSGSGSGSQQYQIAADRAAQAQWDDKSRRAIRITTKPCPSCRVPTERAAGCHHMSCTKCQFDWCWVCQTKWGRDCQGNHWFG